MTRIPKVIFILTLFGICAPVAEGQILRPLLGDNVVTEHPVYLDEKGAQHSSMIYVKFREKVVERQDEHLTIEVLTQGLGEELSSTLRIIEAQYGPFSIRRVYPESTWGDTLVTNRRTGRKVSVPDFSQVVALGFKRPVHIQSVIDTLSARPEVEYVEGPLVAYLVDTPNDWLYANGPQWSLSRINAEKAWDYAKGSGITIAIVDSWVPNTTVHYDLDGRLTNSFGYYGGHGVQVASVAGAITNNSVGMASLGWHVELTGYHMAAPSIKMAADDGAHVINNSWITTANSQQLSDNVYYALSIGAVVVGAAGNDEYCTSCVKYPAAHWFDIGGVRHEVLAVSATMANDDFRTGWTYSPGTDPVGNPTTGFIDVAAPGDETTGAGDGVWVAYTYSDGSGHSLIRAAGTSYAAPQVSALAALLLSIDNSLNPPDVYRLITRSADKIGQYSYDANEWNRYLGYGRINAGNAVCSVASGCLLDPPSNLVVTNVGMNGQPVKLAWTAPKGVINTYKVYRRNPGGLWSHIASTSATIYTDPQVFISPKMGSNDYLYRVAAVDFGGEETNYSNQVTIWGQPGAKNGDGSGLTERHDAGFPAEFKLLQNAPNPFNPSTTIGFELSEAEHVRLVIYDATGREVARLLDHEHGAGTHQIHWDASAFPSGVYFYRVEAGRIAQIRSMVLSK